MKTKILVTLFLFAALSSNVMAQQTIISNIPPADGNRWVYELVGAEKSAAQHIFWFESPGNNSFSLDFQAEAPAGAVVSAKIINETGLSAEATANAFNSSTETLDLLGFNKSAVTSVVLDNTIKGVQPSLPFNPIDCTFFTQEYINAILEGLRFSLGSFVTEDSLCGRSSASDTSTLHDSSNGAAQGVIAVTKDACVSSASSTQRIGIMIDLRGISEEVRNKPVIHVAVTLSAINYRGGKEGSIKPVSEGIFAPKPLALMQYLNQSDKTRGLLPQQLSVYQFSKGKKKLLEKGTIKQTAYYRGLSLVRYPIDKLLRKHKGKKATFELSNGRDRYGICFKLERKRQKTKRYPGGNDKKL